MRRLLVLALLLCALPVGAQVNYYPDSGAKVSNALFVGTDFSPSTTNEETWQTVAIPAGKLATNGDGFFAQMQATTAANTNTKYISINWVDTSSRIALGVTSTSGAGIINWAYCYRVSNTALRCSGWGHTSNTYLEITSINLTTTSYNVLFSARGNTAGSDIAARLAVMRWMIQ